MQRAALVITALAISSLAAGCSAPDDDTTVAVDALTSGIGPGTYLVESRPFGSSYTSRITFGAGTTYEAEMVSSAGQKSILAGRYDVLPARPNDPQSPVLSDKPTLIMSSDSGAAPVAFEFDAQSDGRLKLYHSGRRVSFTVKRDPSWRAEPTNTKVIACTGQTVDAKLTLDQAQNRRGTLVITRKAAAGRHDPPSATVPMTKNENPQVRDRVYFEGSKGEQDYYVNLKKVDFERRAGNVPLNLRWAEGGQEWSLGVTCAFAP
jgi:hypothetical protein